MSLIGIALDNLKRRKAKAVILAIGLFIAIATMVTLFTVTVSMRENIDAQLDEFGTNLLITPKYKDTPLTYGGIVVSNINNQPVKELSMSDIPKMRTIEVAGNLNIISPKLVGPVTYKKRTALVVGIQFKDELRIKTWWQYTGKKPEGKQEAVAGNNLVAKRAIAATNYGKNEVIAGADFAKKFGVSPGNKIKLGNDTFLVSSVLKETGSSDDSVLFMDLGQAQNVLHKKGQISFIEANAYCLDCPLDKIAGQLRGKLPYANVSALREAMSQKQETLSLFTSFSIASSIILVVIAIVIVLVTMMASVKERTREIGIFRAIGFRKRHIITIIISEAASVSIAGGLAGYLAGFAISKVLVSVIAPQAAGFYFNPNNINVSLLAASIVSSLLLGFLSTLYPAIKAANLDPASALRFI